MERDFRQAISSVLEPADKNRRELLKRMGLTATAALAGSALPGHLFARSGAAAGESKVFPVTTVNHLSYASRDWAKARDFYVDLFGMRVVWDDGKSCALEFGSVAAPNGMYIRSFSATETKPSINHIGYGLPNFMEHKAALRAELERRGLGNFRPDGEVGWICDDPVGYMLNIIVIKDKAMYPGAATPCDVAASEACKAGWESGIKNLENAPKPSGKGFKATHYSYVVLNVSDIPKEREFYKEALGMKVIGEKPNECFLRFGENTLILRPAGPDGKAVCNQFAFAVQNFNGKAVEAELKRRGLDPKPETELGWSITDPDGLKIAVAANGLPERMAKG